MEEAVSAGFWLALLEIITINIVLSGDNALVIALACRGLPPRARRWGIAFGTVAAIVLRIIFAVVIVFLLRIPLLMLAGSALLMWIAIKLVMPEKSEHEFRHRRLGLDLAGGVGGDGGRCGDEPRQRHRGGRRRQGQPAAARSRHHHLDPAGGARQRRHALCARPLPDPGDRRLRAARLGRRRARRRGHDRPCLSRRPRAIPDQPAPFICCAIVVAVGWWATSNQGKPTARELMPLDGDGEGNR